MKREKMLSAMDLIDEPYIVEADPARIHRRRKRTIRIVAIAAALSLLLTAALWLFIPYNTNPPSVAKYKNSDYYGLIQKINELTYDRPAYDNNFDYVLYNAIDVVGGGTSKDATNEMEMAPTDDGEVETTSGTANGQEYHEATDNQVQGVIEGDIIKRSDKYIYYFGRHNSILRVYDINGEASKEVGRFDVSTLFDTTYIYDWQTDIYLSEDCSTVTVIAPHEPKRQSAAIKLISLDVTDPTAITVKKEVTITGSYLSSRMVDGKLLLVSLFNVKHNPDFSDESQFIPQIDSGNGPESIPADSIYFPENPTSARYTVVSLLDENSLEVDGSSAFLSYAQDVYVSKDSVYLTRGYTDKTTEGDITRTVSMTEIARLSYADNTLEHKGTVTVKGYIKDQYSLDQHEGYLRVVTTTSTSAYREKTYGNGTVSAEILAQEENGTNASLYVIALNDLTVTAKVENFAPWGETVRSVRFDGTAAYVCTSVQLSDPVFFFDLSDLSKITYKDTGTIEGFSTSLVNFGNGYLLGIGQGADWGTVKIEIYEETADGVASVASYEFENATYADNYKSYLIDRENGMVGLGIQYYYPTDGQVDHYVLLHFNGYELMEMVNVPLHGSVRFMRALHIDGTLYMFSENEFKTASLLSYAD